MAKDYTWVKRAVGWDGKASLKLWRRFAVNCVSGKGYKSGRRVLGATLFTLRGEVVSHWTCYLGLSVVRADFAHPWLSFSPSNITGLDRNATLCTNPRPSRMLMRDEPP